MGKRLFYYLRQRDTSLIHRPQYRRLRYMSSTDYRHNIIHQRRRLLIKIEALRIEQPVFNQPGKALCKTINITSIFVSAGNILLRTQR